MALAPPDDFRTVAIPAALRPRPTGAARMGAAFRWLTEWWALVILLVMLFFCFVWPLVYPLADSNYGDLGELNWVPFSPGHILGTDHLGVDELSRVLAGGRTSITISVMSVAIGMIVGTAIGVVAGYLGGIVETVLARVLDVLLAVPSLVLALIIVTYLGGSAQNLILAISFFVMPSFGRLARAATLRLRERTFILAGRLSGSSRVRIMVRHIVPNIFPQLLTYALITVGTAIMIETSLSFLGLGIPEPAPSWGNMVGAAQTKLSSYPAAIIIPILFIFVTVLAINRLGDGLRARWSQQ